MATVGRQTWRLFLLLAMVACAAAQNLPTTTVADTVYEADGQPAKGVLLISWPEFITADGHAVAAGKTNTALGAGGALSVRLVPNAGASPANTVYTVVYQTQTVKTEYWIVPTTSPATLAAVRTVLGTANSASQMATQQFVQSAIAQKADDNDVVHLGGNETIGGVKQFSVTPQFPGSSGPSPGATQDYVDSALQTVGSGSYVSKAGDTMTGPLTLSGLPNAANQAANKGYVDSGLNTKADLVSGLAPTAERGAGAANSGVCLHGDSTWGACGSSSNAVSIQNVPVDPVPPTDNQVLTYVAAAGKYSPRSGGGGVSGGMQAIKYATDFSWTQSPSADLSAAGSKTVSLIACPAGVLANEPYYYVYVAGAGTPEAVAVTGGTCAGNGQPGTLQFTTLNAHPAGYTVGSASSGLQEALIAARITPGNPTGPQQSGKVVVPPGELSLYARVSIRSSDITVDFSGAILNCYMQDTCVFVGDPMNANAFLDITLVSPRGRPMVVNGQNPFIRINAQKTRLLNVATRIPPLGATFSSLVQVDNDQSFLLDGLDTALATGSNNYGVLCNATVCNPVIYAPGPFTTNAAVGWLKNLNISLQCAGNGIDWQSGNSLKISDSVIEGFAQYGVRAGVRRGGYSGFELDNVYEEVGSCQNPAGNIGQAGIIAQGSTVKVGGPVSPNGVFPQFTNTGSSDYRYFVVAHNSTYGASNVLFAGQALTSGTGTINVSWPDIVGASSFDLLRTIYKSDGAPREQAPYGTGNYAVAAGLNRATVCSNGVCQFADTQAALQNYSVPTPTYYPLIDFWPGNVVLSASKDSQSVLDAAVAHMESVPIDVVGVQGMQGPAVIADYCDPLYEWSPLWLTCYATRSPGGYYDQTSLLLPVKPNADGGLRTNLKGRVNFATLGTGPGHIITLSDSNFQKTIATANNRPSNDVNDAFVGYDQGDGNPAHLGISVGAPVSISNYVGNVGDGQNWLERLTGSLKEFKTNVQMDGAVTVSGTAQAAGFSTSGTGNWALQGSFGPLSPVGSGKSALGFGANGKLQVSENGGVVAELAKLDASGNVSENANTASQLAQTPSVCNGSFATGILPNGNAICSTADVIQLAETSAPPAGLPNYGIFWFDSACHCPKVIDNNGQPVQLGLQNVFNADANTLEERNGTWPQALRIYQTTDANEQNYSRLSLGWDAGKSRYQIASDYAGNGSAYGIEFKLGGTIPWYIGSNFNLLTESDNLRDIGSDSLGVTNNGLGIHSLYYGTALDGELNGGNANDWPNDSTTGTSANRLAKLTASGAAVLPSTSDQSGVIGIVIAGAGTSYNAEIISSGFGSCIFDGPTTTGDYVQISSKVAGDCQDVGPAYPASGQVLGRVMVTNAAAGNYKTYFFGMGAQGASSSANSVGSVFGRIGSVTAQAGDYTVSQVTGAAPSASPIFSGAPTAPTPAMSDSSTQIATTAFVKGQGYGTGTITGVTAGPGLTGGGTSGAVTLGLTNTCGNGQILQWNGSVWVCAANSAITSWGAINGTISTQGDLQSEFQSQSGRNCALETGTDPGQQISNCISNSGEEGTYNAKGITGNQSLTTAMIPSGNPFGELLLGNAVYWLTDPNGGGAIVIPTRFHVRGIGSAQNGQGDNTVIRACHGDTTGTPCGGHTWGESAPAGWKPIIVCFGSSGGCGGVNGPGSSNTFDSYITNLQVDCNYIPSCIGVQNKIAQEDSGAWYMQILNWGNGGIGLDVETEVPPGWQSSHYYSSGYFVQPAAPNGHYYKTTGACTSNGSEPTWHTDGTSTSDGPCTWQDKDGPQTTVAGYPAWQSSRSYASGIAILPSVFNNHYYTASANCTSGSSEPAWRTDGTNTAGDGTCSWNDKNTPLLWVNPGNSTYDHLTIQNLGSGSCTASSRAIKYDFTAGHSDPVKEFSVLTLNNSGCSSTNPDANFEVSSGGPQYSGGGGAGSIAHVHCETSTDCIRVGVTGPTVGLDINGVEGYSTNKVHVMNTYASGNITIKNVAGSSTLIKDDINGNTLTKAGEDPDGVVGMYFIGASGGQGQPSLSLISSSTNVASKFGGGITGTTVDGVSPTVMGYLDATSSIQGQLNAKAPLASPFFTGTPQAPTPSVGDNSTKLATTAYVQSQGYLTGVGPYSSFWALPGSVSTTTPIACSGSGNKATLWGISITYPVKTSNVSYYVQGTDNTANTYDLGLYSASGTQIVHTGPIAGTQFAPSQGYKAQAWITANTVIQPGNYYLALACSATSGTATFGYTYAWAGNANTPESVATAGTLPNSITVPGSFTMTNASTMQAAIF